MKETDFKTRAISETHIDNWIKIGQERPDGLNVLLSGAHGTGKTTLILDGFKRHNMKFLYYSGSTLDPWTDVVGIPDVSVDGKTQLKFIDYVLPKAWLDNDIEAIFIDEYNRAPKKVKNALMELQQFKSINGRKFPKLKSIWAAINPPPAEGEEGDDNLEYDVDTLDPAQLDRFHIIVNIPTKPSLKYFKSKYGNHIGQVAVDWWLAQNAKVKKILSPRRLDYACEIFKLGGNISEIIPFAANTTELVSELNSNPETRLLDSILAAPTRSKLEDFLMQVPDAIEKYRDKFLNTKHYEFYDMFPKDIISELLLKDKNFQYFSIAKSTEDDKFYSELFSEIEKATPSRRIVSLSRIVRNRCKADNINPFEGDSQQSGASSLTEAQIATFIQSNSSSVGQKTDYNSILSFWAPNPSTNCNTGFVANITDILSAKSKITDMPSFGGTTSDRRRASQIALNNMNNILSSSLELERLTIYALTNIISMQKGTLQKEPNSILLLALLLAKIQMCNLINRPINSNVIVAIKDCYTSYKYKLKTESSKTSTISKYLEFINSVCIDLNNGTSHSSSNNVSKEFIAVVNTCNSALDVVLQNSH